MPARLSSPYKFLDAYGPDDRQLFFGRERETQILLADVIVNRLVVLFAKTGTGKTSLINAGIRPELERRGYSTFMVRVQHDPTTSAATALLDDDRIERLNGETFPAQLEDVVERLQQPIVIVFDQFEEFFIYLMGRRENRDRGRRFISDVADLHADRGSGVHVVFSMREDFMAAMDDFREYIPTIFHQDSNLRLRWFDDDQARAAIRGPAATRGAPFDDALVERLVEDLRDDDGIEPAQLQIVCDTLWRRSADGRVTESDYEALGEGGGSGTVADRILRRRLEEEFDKVQDRRHLQLLEALLPTLRTPQGTKYIRDLPSLVRELDTDADLLRSTLSHLEERSRLVRISVRDSIEYVELTHDYLVNHLTELSAAVSVIWPRRVIRRAVAGDDPPQAEDVEDVLDRVRAEHHRALAAGRRALGDVELDADQAGFLLRFALDARMQASVVKDAFAIAAARGADVHGIIAEALAGEVAAAETAVELAVELGASQAERLLPAVIARRDDLARHTIDLLGAIEAPFAVALLRRALASEELSPAPQLALTALAASRQDEVAAPAAAHLVSHLLKRLDAGDVAAIADLGRVENVGAVNALAELLERDDAVGDARSALQRLSESTNRAVAGVAIDVLTRHLAEAVRSGDVPPHVIEALGSLEEVAVVGVLEAALEREPHAHAAQQALLRLYRSRRAEVATAAAEALALHGESRVVPPLPEQPSVEGPRTPWRPPPVVTSTPLEPHFTILIRRLLEGRVIPFLGAGVNLAGRPPGAAWNVGEFLPSGAELSRHLADQFAFPSDDDAYDVSRVAQYGQLVAGSAVLYDVLRDVFDRDYAPTRLHTLLAGLPAAVRRSGNAETSVLLVTANYDDLLERAFAASGEPVDVVSYLTAHDHGGKWLHAPAGGEPLVIERPDEYQGFAPGATVILKLHGGIDRTDAHRDSFVITEDDYLDYAATVDLGAGLPVTLAARLRRSHFLFLGYSLRDWNLRLVLRRIWGEQRMRYKSWAVLAGAGKIDQLLWRERDVDIIDAWLDEYADELAGHLALESGA